MSTTAWLPLYLVAAAGASPPKTPSDASAGSPSRVAPPASAKRDRAGRPGSPQRFALELKVGPYLPDVDRTYSGDGLGPYATIFGETDGSGVAVDEPKNAVMPAAEFDWQFFYAGGPLGLGVQVAFMRDKAAAIVANPTDDDDTIRSEADSVTFSTLPLSALFTYRLELLPDRFRIPVVPYAKAGLSYAFWWTRDGRGNLARDDDGDVGAGGVWGFTIAGGLMLRLDFLERTAAKKLDQTTGINHTYLLGEFQLSRLDNFGAGNSISVGDATWSAGLAIEF